MGNLNMLKERKPPSLSDYLRVVMLGAHYVAWSGIYLINDRSLNVYGTLTQNVVEMIYNPLGSIGKATVHVYSMTRLY